MAGTFNCPTCGAPLDYPGNGDTMRCPYCNNSVIVPEELRSGGRSDSRTSPEGTPGLNQVPGEFQAVLKLAQAGRKIEAIKLYRAITNAGLAEAKTAVERMAAGQPVQFGGLQTSSRGGSPLSDPQLAQIKAQLEAGNKIEAIKLYRQFTGVGLKEAKDAVEGVTPGSSQNQKGTNWKAKLVMIAVGLFFLGIASIFPLVFIPMGITSLQENELGAAIGSFIGAGIWALVWGSIGVFLFFA